MFWLALGAVILGTAVGIGGAIISSQEEEEQRKAEEEQAEEEQVYLEEAAEFAALRAETQAGMLEEQAGLVRKETAAEVGEMGEAGAGELATHRAATFAGGLEGGTSYEAVRRRFEQRLMGQVGRTYERGTLSAQQLLTKASLARAGSEVEQEYYKLQIAGLGRELEALEYQEDIAPWKLGLEIGGSVIEGGLSLATSGLKPPSPTRYYAGWL